MPVGHPAVEERIASLLHATHDKAWEAATARAAALAPGLADGPIGATAGDPARFPAASRRAALAAHADELHRANLVRRAAGQAELPGASVAVAILTEFAREFGPGSTAWLCGRLAGYIGADRAELEAIGAELDALVASGEAKLVPADLVGRVARQHALESRVPARQAALEAFRAALPGKIKDAVGKSAEALTSALGEILALEDRLPQPDGAIALAEHELALTDDKLRKLGVVSGVAPGPISTALSARRDQVAKQLEAARAGHAGRVQDAIQGQVKRALDGDLDAWVAVADAVASHSDVFPAGLADKLPGAGLAALVGSDATLWADALVGAVAGGPGRDFAHSPAPEIEASTSPATPAPAPAPKAAPAPAPAPAPKAKAEAAPKPA